MIIPDSDDTDSEFYRKWIENNDDNVKTDLDGNDEYPLNNFDGNGENPINEFLLMGHQISKDINVITATKEKRTDFESAPFPWLTLLLKTTVIK